MVQGTLKSGGNAGPVTNGKLRGDMLSFSAGGANYSGRVNGNSIEGNVTMGGNTTKWNATRR